jgi:hypothetical protein
MVASKRPRVRANVRSGEGEDSEPELKPTYIPSRAWAEVDVGIGA